MYNVHKADAPWPEPCEDAPPIVLSVDDDEQMRTAFVGLVRSARYRVALHADALELLLNPLLESVRCPVANVRPPLVSGVDLHPKLTKRGERVPIHFITGHGVFRCR